MIKKKANQQSWIEKSNAIIESIADEFDCVCYVDLNKNPQEDNVEIFHTCQFLVTCVPALRGELNLEKRLDLICNNFVCPDDRDTFYKSTRLEAILQNLEKNSQYMVPFRCQVDATEYYYQMSFFANRDESGAIKGFVLRLRNIDRDIRLKQRYELDRHLNESIVMKFGEQVESVFVFNPTKRMFRTLYCREELKGLFPTSGPLERSGTFVAKDIIHPADRKKMLEGLSFDNVLERLSRENSFRILFRDIALGYARWFEVRVMRFDIGDENEFLVGFVNKNEDVINQKINEKVRDEFISIYLINLEEKIIHVVRRSEFYHDDDKKVYEFKEGLDKAIAYVHKDYREQWEKLGDIEYLKNLFAKEERREFICKNIGPNNSVFGAVMFFVFWIESMVSLRHLC